MNRYRSALIALALVAIGAPVSRAAGGATDPIRVLWWDATDEFGGQAADALRQQMSDYLDGFAGGGVFDATYVATTGIGALATFLSGHDFDVIVIDATTLQETFDFADQHALMLHYVDHPNLLLDGTLYVRSIVFNATSIFPGVNGSTGAFTADEVLQLAQRGGGILFGTDHDCCSPQANYLLDEILPGAAFCCSTTASLNAQFLGSDLTTGAAVASAIDLVDHWASIPSPGVAPTGTFVDVRGEMVELHSQVRVEDLFEGTLETYVSTSWSPTFDGPDPDCNGNDVLDAIDVAGGSSPDLDGNGTPDECEQVGVNYCGPGVPNSTGAPGGLLSTGSDAAGDEDVTLTAYDLPPGNVALFLASVNQGFNPQPGTSCGNLCLMGPDVARFKLDAQVVDASGRASLRVDPFVILTNPPQPILSGQTWYFQGWHRDSGALPDCNNNFTDAVELTFR